MRAIYNFTSFSYVRGVRIDGRLDVGHRSGFEIEGGGVRALARHRAMAAAKGRRFY